MFTRSISTIFFALSSAAVCHRSLPAAKSAQNYIHNTLIILSLFDFAPFNSSFRFSQSRSIEPTIKENGPSSINIDKTCQRENKKTDRKQSFWYVQVHSISCTYNSIYFYYTAIWVLLFDFIKNTFASSHFTIYDYDSFTLSPGDKSSDRRTSNQIECIMQTNAFLQASLLSNAFLISLLPFSTRLCFLFLEKKGIKSKWNCICRTLNRIQCTANMAMKLEAHSSSP